MQMGKMFGNIQTADIFYPAVQAIKESSLLKYALEAKGETLHLLNECHISDAYRVIAGVLSSKCQGMGRTTRVVIESMEEKAAYIPGVRGLSRDA
jgi:hypothetical protein